MFDDQDDENNWEEYDPAPPEPDYDLPKILADLRAPWRERAACKGKPTWWWYPIGAGGLDAHPTAKRICSTCPVREECLTASLDDPEGYWGGEGMRARRRIAHDRRIRAQRAARGLT